MDTGKSWQRKCLLGLALALSCAAGAGAQEAAAPAGSVISDPAIKLSLDALPEGRDAETTSAVIVYLVVAKAWWLDTRCHISAPADVEALKNNVAGLTGGMRMFLQKKFAISETKAGEYVEKFQMYQLESLSAAKFYDCGPQASRAFSLGQLVLQQQMNKPK
jgi:hypothetical protein